MVVWEDMGVCGCKECVCVCEGGSVGCVTGIYNVNVWVCGVCKRVLKKWPSMKI